MSQSPKLPLEWLSSRLRNGANTTKSTAQNTAQITTCATTSKTSDITTPSGYPPPKENKNINRETNNANTERMIHNRRKTIRAIFMAFCSGLRKLPEVLCALTVHKSCIRTCDFPSRCRKLHCHEACGEQQHPTQAVLGAAVPVCIM